MRKRGVGAGWKCSTPISTTQRCVKNTPFTKLPQNLQIMQNFDDAMIRAHIRSYLVSKGDEAVAHLTEPIRALVKQEGGIFSNGTFMVFDKTAHRYVAITWPKRQDELSDLVRHTKEPLTNGGQESTALIELLQRVADRMHKIGEKELASITKASKLSKMVIGSGKEAEEIPRNFCILLDDNGNKLRYNPHILTTNITRIHPKCVLHQWFLAIALRPGLGDSVVFDELNSTVRSKSHVVDFSTGDLKIRPLKEKDRMLLDAGHDLEMPALALDDDDGFSGEVGREVQEVRDMMEAWMGENTDFFLVCIAERLFCFVRKEAHVFETPSDRGKTALLDVLLMGLGSYARRLPNEAVTGANKRTAPIHEATLSRSGVRFILHDEVDTIDWLYLKSQSNAAEAMEWGIGMTATLTSAHKATRIITRNAGDAKTVAAPEDCRRKVVLWTGDTLKKPPANQELYERIKGKDPVLARAFFLLVVDTYRRLNRQRPDMPVELIAGADLVPAPPSEGQTNSISEMEQGMQAITIGTRREFHRLFRASTKEEGGTKAEDVKAAICSTEGMPAMLAKLSLESFTQDVLRVGTSMPNDPEVVPQVEKKDWVGSMGDIKRARLSSVMMCVRR